MVVSPVVIPLLRRDLAVQETLWELAPTVIESDARAPALAEAMYGAGRPFKVFAYITVGTGISCCLVQDGQTYTGARGNALVLGSMPLTTVCTHCGTVLNPVLEEIASGPALVAQYNQRCGTNERRGEAVLAAVETGNPVATEIVARAGASLGNSVAFLVNIMDRSQSLSVEGWG